MNESEKADITFHSTITINETAIEKVLCKIYLPKKMIDQIDLTFYPNDKQAEIIRNLPFWKMSFRGETINYEGNPEKTVSSETTYVNQFKTLVHSQDFTEPYLKAETTDLTIIHHFNRPTGNQKVTGSFWITPNNLLEPDFSSTYSYTGDVKIDTAGNFEFMPDAQLLLKFNNHYKRYTNVDGDNVSFYELVADFELDGETNESPKILESLRKLDDILLLASFAARQRCVCLGWDSYDSKTSLTKYLRNRTFPSNSDNRGNYDELIEKNNFEEFMKTVFQNFQKYADIEAFRRTLNFIIPKYKDTVDGNFVSLYSALEMVILHFRRKNEIELILEKKKFEKLRSNFKKYIDEFDFSKLVNEDIDTEELSEIIEAKKGLIKEKLSELNRISFKSAFEEFCKYHSVDISDLWFVTGKGSLSDIRNKLVHGEHFSQNHYDGLLYARENLRWIIERMVLAILGWSVEKSNVSSSYLSHKIAYKRWHNELAKFQ